MSKSKKSKKQTEDIYFWYIPKADKIDYFLTYLLIFLILAPVAWIILGLFDIWIYELIVSKLNLSILPGELFTYNLFAIPVVYVVAYIYTNFLKK